MKLYDSIIVGGGPAGLSAAIYLGRFNRSVLIIDAGHGRMWSHEINENYLGFPEGIASKKLRFLGEQQAKHFGAEFVNDRINRIEKIDNLFHMHGTAGEYKAKTIILATGVKDVYPKIDHIEEYIGESLFWCITCDGYKVRSKNVMVVGHSDEAACTCMQFLNFTDKLTFVTNKPIGEDEVSEKWRERLRMAGIKFYPGTISEVYGNKGQLEEVVLHDGTKIELEYMINQQLAIPNTQLAEMLSIQLASNGYIDTNEEQRTNVPFVYAAGDVTRPFSHQIVTAVHEGSMAAQAANYDLYAPEQREDV